MRKINQFIDGKEYISKSDRLGDIFNPAQGEPTLCGVIIETSTDGLSESIEPFRIGGILSQTKKQ